MSGIPTEGDFTAPMTPSPSILTAVLRLPPPLYLQQPRESPHLAEAPRLGLLAERLHLLPVVVVDASLPLVVGSLTEVVGVVMLVKVVGVAVSHNMK